LSDETPSAGPISNAIPAELGPAQHYRPPMNKEAEPKNGPLVDLQGATLARNTVYSFLGLAVPYLVAFASIPFVIRGLGLDRFGILSLVWVVFGYFTLFDLGLGRTTTKYVSEALGRGEMEKLPHYVWTTVGLQLLFAGVGGLIFILGAPLIAERLLKIPVAYVQETKTTFILVALSLPVNFVMNSFRGTLEAGQKFGLVNAVKIPASILFYILPIVGLLLGFHLPGIVFLLILSRVVALAVWLWLALKTYPVLRVRPRLDRAYIKPLFSFSLWIAASSIIYTVVLSVDKFLIGALLSVKSVAYYSAPNEAIIRLGIIPGSFALILFPAFSALSGAGRQDGLERLFSRAAKYLLMLSGPILVIVLNYAPVLLRLWLGQDFARQSATVVRLLAAGFLVSSLWTVPFSFLQGTGRVDIATKLQFLEAAFFLVTAFFFIGNWGINGAAAATALRLLLFTSILFALAMHFGHIRVGRFLSRDLLKVIGGLIIYGFSLALCNRAHAGPIAAILPTVLLFIFFFYFALDNRERRFLLDLRGTFRQKER
jgi:O-antigen/teichoic acid export membrane protein